MVMVCQKVREMVCFWVILNHHLKENCIPKGTVNKVMWTNASQTTCSERTILFEISFPSWSNSLVKYNQNELLEKWNKKKRHTEGKLNLFYLLDMTKIKLLFQNAIEVSESLLLISVLALSPIGNKQFKDGRGSTEHTLRSSGLLCQSLHWKFK